MPKPPDFDVIALDLARGAIGTIDPQATALLQVKIVEQLRQVWNARGAADMRELEAPVGAIVDGMRALDR